MPASWQRQRRASWPRTAGPCCSSGEAGDARAAPEIMPAALRAPPVLPIQINNANRASAGSQCSRPRARTSSPPLLAPSPSPCRCHVEAFKKGSEGWQKRVAAADAARREFEDLFGEADAAAEAAAARQQGGEEEEEEAEEAQAAAVAAAAEQQQYEEEEDGEQQERPKKKKKKDKGRGSKGAAAPAPEAADEAPAEEQQAAAARDGGGKDKKKKKQKSEKKSGKGRREQQA